MQIYENQSRFARRVNMSYSAFGTRHNIPNAVLRNNNNIMVYRCH